VLGLMTKCPSWRRGTIRSSKTGTLAHASRYMSLAFRDVHRPIILTFCRHRGDHAGERDPPAQETPVMKHRSSGKDSATTAAHARKTFSQLSKRIDAKLAGNRIAASRHVGSSSSRKLNAADQLGAAISRYPDELLDLTPEQRHAELRAAYQDPVTREPQPIIWLPEDPAGGSEDSIERSKKYGRVLQYSNAGAYLTKEGKCEITQPAPDVRSDWLLDWVL